MSAYAEAWCIFDRDVSDPSGLTFEEWQPLTVFSEQDIGKTLNTASGVIKVKRTVRADVCWGDDPPSVNSKTIAQVDTFVGGWVAEFREGGSRQDQKPTQRG